MGSDKRTSRRAPVVLRIKLRYTSVDHFVQKFATNISPGGMFISSRTPKPVGSVLKFELRLADDSAVVAGEGVVRWVQEYDPEHPRRLHGMGIEFSRLSDDSRDLLGRVVDHKRSLGLPDDNDIPMSSRRTAARPGRMATAPVVSSEPAPSETAPAPVAAEAPTAEPARPRRAPVDMAALIASAEPNQSVMSDDELARAVEADVPNLGATLARARELAGAAGDDDLDALLKVSASPVARSVDDASGALAALTGTSPVASRRRRRNGQNTPTTEPPGPERAGATSRLRRGALEPAPAPATEAEAEAEPPGPERAGATSRLSRTEPEPPGPERAGATSRLSRTEPDSDEPTSLDAAPVEQPAAAEPQLLTGPGAPPPPRSPPPPPTPDDQVLDVLDDLAASSSGTIDITDLAELADEPVGLADALSHDLDASALDAEELMASGIESLSSGSRRRHTPSPVALPEGGDLSSFADPPTTDVPGAPDDLDAALASLEASPPPVPQSPVVGDYDADANALLTRADGPPMGMGESDFDIDIVLDDDPASDDADDDEAKKKGIFSRVFGRKKP